MNPPPPEPQTLSEMLAVQNGEDLAAYRRNRELLDCLSTQAQEFIDRPPAEWPRPAFNWDLALESQRFALDGITSQDFRFRHPTGLSLGWVSLPEFDAKLCKSSRRDGANELWNLGDKSKLARVFAYLSRSLPISPPIVAITKDGEFHLVGGNHRYAAAKISLIERIPIYISPKDCARFERLVTVCWK